MKCAIYKSRRKADTYLYVEEESNFARVPASLLTLLGELEFVMTLELSPQRTLAQADPEEVRRQLREQGYYLQLPASEFPAVPS
ncbi:MAG: YcgL domain-containing protein [Acidiferrobacterales bacterium]